RGDDQWRVEIRWAIARAPTAHAHPAARRVELAAGAAVQRGAANPDERAALRIAGALHRAQQSAVQEPRPRVVDERRDVDLRSRLTWLGDGARPRLDDRIGLRRSFSPRELLDRRRSRVWARLVARRDTEDRHRTYAQEPMSPQGGAQVVERLLVPTDAGIGRRCVFHRVSWLPHICAAAAVVPSARRAEELESSSETR